LNLTDTRFKTIIDFSPSSSLATGKYAAALADARRAAEIDPSWAKPRARIGDAVRESSFFFVLSHARLAPS
jgi:hypothetical protein